MRGCHLGSDSTRFESQVGKNPGRCEGRGDKADEQKDNFKLQRQLSLAKQRRQQVSR